MPSKVGTSTHPPRTPQRHAPDDTDRLNRLDTDIDWGETESVQAPRTDPFGGASRSPDTGPGSETKQSRTGYVRIEGPSARGEQTVIVGIGDFCARRTTATARSHKGFRRGGPKQETSERPWKLSALMTGAQIDGSDDA